MKEVIYHCDVCECKMSDKNVYHYQVSQVREYDLCPVCSGKAKSITRDIFSKLNPDDYDHDKLTKNEISFVVIESMICDHIDKNVKPVNDDIGVKIKQYRDLQEMIENCPHRRKEPHFSRRGRKTNLVNFVCRKTNTYCNPNTNCISKINANAF